MVTLHHLEYSQSFRVLWLLEELGIEYRLELYRRDIKTLLAPGRYKAISPLGTAPVLTHGDLALTETNAILDYLIDLYPHETLRPEPGSSDRTRHLFWLHASQGSMMPLMLMDSVFRILQQRVPALIRPLIRSVLNRARSGFIDPRMSTILELAEEHLDTAEWFGGQHLTIADIAMIYPMESASKRGSWGDNYKNCQAWLQRVYQRPAFESAKIKDGRPGMVLPL